MQIFPGKFVVRPIAIECRFCALQPTIKVNNQNRRTLSKNFNARMQPPYLPTLKTRHKPEFNSELPTDTSYMYGYIIV